MQGSNHIISTNRLEETSGKEDYGATEILSDVAVWIEQLDKKASLMWSGDSSLLINLMHIDGLPDIKTSDLVTDDDGVEYIVQGVQFFKGADIPSHTEVIMAKQHPKV